MFLIFGNTSERGEPARGPEEHQRQVLSRTRILWPQRPCDSCHLLGSSGHQSTSAIKQNSFRSRGFRLLHPNSWHKCLPEVQWWVAADEEATTCAPCPRNPEAPSQWQTCPGLYSHNGGLSPSLLAWGKAQPGADSSDSSKVNIAI